MVGLACNYIPALFELLDSGTVVLDYIKCPLSPNSRAEVTHALVHRPVLLHGWGPPRFSFTRPKLLEPELLVELSKQSCTPFISSHLDYQPEIDGELTPEQVIARVAQQVSQVRELTGLEVLIENLHFHPNKSRPRYTTDPEFIAEVLEAAEAGYLLDIAHADVAAYHRQETLEDYLSRMPLNKVIEIHVSRPRHTEEGLRDGHLELGPEQYHQLEWLLPQTPNLKMLTLEYFGKDETGTVAPPDVTREQLEELDELRQAIRETQNA